MLADTRNTSTITEAILARVPMMIPKTETITALPVSSWIYTCKHNTIIACTLFKARISMCLFILRPLSQYNVAENFCTRKISPLYYRNTLWIYFHQCGKGCHILYAIISTGDKKLQMKIFANENRRQVIFSW